MADLANVESEFERLARLESEMRGAITSFSASDRLSREKVRGRDPSTQRREF